MELIGLAIVAVVALYAIVIYNGLVKARQMKEEAWSGIDVQLKRRTDLIPNLIETVKGYAALPATSPDGTACARLRSSTTFSSVPFSWAA